MIGLLAAWLAGALPVAAAPTAGVRRIAQLRDLDPASASAVVSVAGYYRGGDAGGGRFVWDPAAREPEDGGLVIASTVRAEGRWRRLTRRLLTPQMFGARADGATDDAPQLRATFDAFAALRADTIHFPGGTYFLDSTEPETLPLVTQAIVRFGHRPLNGRRINLLGRNARLFSNISPVGAPILLGRASFRSLVVRGLTFEKTSAPLAYADEPAEGLYLTAADRREVESVKLRQCTFINCHRAFSAGLYLGMGPRGKLREFEARECTVLFPWGANSLTGATYPGSSQMSYGGPWIDLMIYRDCVFDGASAGPLDEQTCPGLRVLDGAHFGGPQTLIFVGNTVRHFCVEGVFHTAEDYLELVNEPFFVPPTDRTPVRLFLQGRDSDLRPGQRIFIQSAGFFEVIAHDPVRRLLEVVNLGGPRNAPPGTTIPAGRIIYDLDHPPRTSIIANNHIDGGLVAGAVPAPGVTGPGYPGIAVLDARAIITGNVMENCLGSIVIYARQVPGLDRSTHSIVANNVIRTCPPGLVPNINVAGIITDSLDADILDNDITIPAGTFAYGIYPLQNGARILRNRISAILPQSTGYASPQRSTGILVGGQTSDVTIHGNLTRGFDVGVGPPANQGTAYRLGQHRSEGDVLPADLQFTTTFLTAAERARLDAIPRVPRYEGP